MARTRTKSWIHVVLTAFLLLNFRFSQTLLSSPSERSVLSEHDHAVPNHLNGAQQPCTIKEGVIITNTLGRLANNIFETAFANRLASQLCNWNVLYRPMWQGEIPNPRAAECFPKAGIPTNHTVLDISQSLQEKIGLNASFWAAVSNSHGNEQYLAWLSHAEEKQIATGFRHENRSAFESNGVDMLVDRISLDESNEISIVNLQAFFIHGDWMRGWERQIREWFEMNDSCCPTQPPEDAVVIHVRNFEAELGTEGIKPYVYLDILRYYGLMGRPVWIVCQPETVSSHFVKEFTASIPGQNVTVITGQDQYDAFCVLTKSKTLLLSPGSTYSQMAAFLAGPSTQVHYPLMSKVAPPVTLEVPWFRYHLVNASLLDRIEDWDVPTEHIEFVSA